jgi:hypothetical protein
LIQKRVPVQTAGTISGTPSPVRSLQEREVPDGPGDLPRPDERPVAAAKRDDLLRDGVVSEAGDDIAHAVSIDVHAGADIERGIQAPVIPHHGPGGAVDAVHVVVVAAAREDDLGNAVARQVAAEVVHGINPSGRSLQVGIEAPERTAVRPFSA